MIDQHLLSYHTFHMCHWHNQDHFSMQNHFHLYTFHRLTLEFFLQGLYIVQKDYPVNLTLIKQVSLLTFVGHKILSLLYLFDQKSSSSYLSSKSQSSSLRESDTCPLFPSPGKALQSLSTSRSNIGSLRSTGCLEVGHWLVQMDLAYTCWALHGKIICCPLLVEVGDHRHRSCL